MDETPDTQYAKSGDLHVAYQVIGDGPIDVITSPGWISHMECQWEQPLLARFLRRPAGYARALMFDKRGTGLSDRTAGVPTLEECMDDIRAVLDAERSERAALIGHFDSGAHCAMFAATYPERTTALIIVGGYAKGVRDETHPMGPDPAVAELVLAAIQNEWGKGTMLPAIAPSMASDTPFIEWWARFERLSASPGAAAALNQMTREMDIRDILSNIQVPTLIIHREHHPVIPVESAEYLAEHIPGARLVVLPGADALPYTPSGGDDVMDEIQEFLTGVRGDVPSDRVLATVLFTDIVDSTRHASELGDSAWRELLDRHDSTVRRQLNRYRGTEVKSVGDGFLATFDGPARAIQCAMAVRDNLEPLGLDVRAGLHTGEVERRGNDVGGIAVHIGARVAALAGPGEVFASSTVKDLVVGSGIAFDARGSHLLKGVPDEWRVFAVRR
ncbi:MAG TPA: adenylate/guanylate cyclase domain-containing protein [Acidimicrobiia bacterium]